MNDCTGPQGPLHDLPCDSWYVIRYQILRGGDNANENVSKLIYGRWQSYTVTVCVVCVRAAVLW